MLFKSRVVRERLERKHSNPRLHYRGVSLSAGVASQVGHKAVITHVIVIC